ncbi:MAG TPA: NUDIX hydrolase [Longimicrobiales bacterium]|nr:NUDIX hydrolase [Longimicrobiales bacterium]
MAERSVRRSISIALVSPARPGEVLVVRRPLDDPHLPGAWGLPAGSLRSGETWVEAVVRAGGEKLGVELAVTAELERGTLERSDYTLEMALFEAEIVRGAPSVGQPYPEVTQYIDWTWDAPAALRPAAEAGSLCSRLYLAWWGRAHRM